MKIYIDFDHTLYNSNALISDMIDCIANFIVENGNFENYSRKFKKLFPNIELIPVQRDYETIYLMLKNNFKRPKETILKIKYNIYALAQTFADLFSCNYYDIEMKINGIIENGQKYLYDDSVEFLKSMKKEGHEEFILSHEANDLNFQNKKIKGSGVFNPDLLDATIVTKESKALLNRENIMNIEKTSINTTSDKYSKPEIVDYKQGIFIDDRPKDLESLSESVYESNKICSNARIFRMKRRNGTYSNKKLNVRCKNGVKDVEGFEEVYRMIHLLR